MHPSLRLAIPIEEFDYGILMAALASLANPRQKVTALLRQGHIVRVKKGLYVWGEAWRKRPVQREILANLIYGPSLVSGDWALFYHGLIPERVATLTSSTPKVAKNFATPLGEFHYQHVPLEYFPLGMCRVAVESTGFLLAAPERALCDKLMSLPLLYKPSLAQIEVLLLEDLRIDEDGLASLNKDLVNELAAFSHSPRLSQLALWLKSN